MAIRIGRSFADLINALEQITAGLKAATGDAKQKAYAVELGKYLSVLRRLDEKQEKASAWP